MTLSIARVLKALLVRLCCLRQAHYRLGSSLFALKRNSEAMDAFCKAASLTGDENERQETLTQIIEVSLKIPGAYTSSGGNCSVVHLDNSSMLLIAVWLRIRPPFENKLGLIWGWANPGLANISELVNYIDWGNLPS